MFDSHLPWSGSSVDCGAEEIRETAAFLATASRTEWAFQRLEGVGYQYSADAGNLTQRPLVVTPSTQGSIHILADSA
jgi:hypothetical protein